MALALGASASVGFGCEFYVLGSGATATATASPTASPANWTGERCAVFVFVAVFT